MNIAFCRSPATETLLVSYIGSRHHTRGLTHGLALREQREWNARLYEFDPGACQEMTEYENRTTVVATLDEAMADPEMRAALTRWYRRVRWIWRDRAVWQEIGTRLHEAKAA